jgi:hypothetical protein
MGLWRFDSEKARTHVLSHVTVVLAQLRSPANHTGLFERMNGSVPIRLVSAIHRRSVVLYVRLVDFSTEDRYIACASCMMVL